MRPGRGPLLIGALVTTAVLLVGACTSDDSADSTATTTVPGLPSDAETIIDSPTYDNGSWNYLAVDMETGEEVWSQNADRLNFLASTTKLFTGGTYLDTFGPDHTLETPVYATAAPVAGELTGDLVLVGAGDVILGSRNVLDGDLQWEFPDHVYAYATPLATQVEADPLAGLDELAAEVVGLGHHHRRGRRARRRTPLGALPDQGRRRDPDHGQRQPARHGRHRRCRRR